MRENKILPSLWVGSKVAFEACWRYDCKKMGAVRSSMRGEYLPTNSARGGVQHTGKSCGGRWTGGGSGVWRWGRRELLRRLRCTHNMWAWNKDFIPTTYFFPPVFPFKDRVRIIIFKRHKILELIHKPFLYIYIYIHTHTHTHTRKWFFFMLAFRDLLFATHDNFKTGFCDLNTFKRHLRSVLGTPQISRDSRVGSKSKSNREQNEKHQSFLSR